VGNELPHRCRACHREEYEPADPGLFADSNKSAGAVGHVCSSFLMIIDDGLFGELPNGLNGIEKADMKHRVHSQFVFDDLVDVTGGVDDPFQIIERLQVECGYQS
jgi:hypothetical protein